MSVSSSVEAMDEFDSPTELKRTFCKQMSVAEYEEQAIRNTEHHLQVCTLSVIQLAKWIVYGTHRHVEKL